MKKSKGFFGFGKVRHLVELLSLLLLFVAIVYCRIKLMLILKGLKLQSFSVMAMFASILHQSQ